MPATEHEIGIRNLGERLRHIGFPCNDCVYLALGERRRKTELRPDVLDREILVFHLGATQYHLEEFVGCLPAREADLLALEIGYFARLDARALFGNDGERIIAIVASGIVHDESDHL